MVYIHNKLTGLITPFDDLSEFFDVLATTQLTTMSDTEKGEFISFNKHPIYRVVLQSAYENADPIS